MTAVLIGAAVWVAASLVLGRSTVSGAAAEIERLRSEIERLQNWKIQALIVLNKWDDVWDVAGFPGALGMSKAECVADEIRRLRAMTAEQALVHDAWLTERSLADQLADALRAVTHDRPTAHTDSVWSDIQSAMGAYEEARREQ